MADPDTNRTEENRRLDGQDALLHPFLSAPGEDKALNELNALFAGIVIPIVDKTLMQKLRLTATRIGCQFVSTRYLDQEDLRQHTLLTLTIHFWQLYADPARYRVASLHSYVATAAVNSWREAVRRDAKLWTNLSNRLSYLFRGTAGQTGFAKWKHTEHDWLAGFSGWQKQKPGVLNLEHELQQLPSPVAPLPDVAAWVLNHAGGPLPWNDFVTGVALVLQIKDGTISIEGSNLGSEITSVPELASAFSYQDQLQAVWDAVRQIDLKERRVLLLKSEDLLDFELTKVTTLQAIASALELPVRRLLELLPALPLPDKEIAQLLEIKRQSVVNLRRQARSSLRRRLRHKSDPPK